MRTWFFIIAIVGITAVCFAADQPLPQGTQADRVVVMKNERTLTLMSQGRTLKAYKIALGEEPLGPKVHQGDHKDAGRCLRSGSQESE